MRLKWNDPRFPFLILVLLIIFNKLFPEAVSCATATTAVRSEALGLPRSASPSCLLDWLDAPISHYTWVFRFMIQICIGYTLLLILIILRNQTMFGAQTSINR